ncbi:COG3905 Predicted transcriptional regulator [Caulobacteraceae bacterium]|jgi:predicted transcriptional regulator
MPEDKPGFSEDPAQEFDLFEEIDEEAEAAADAEAEADFAAGRFISHEAVMRWVKSWGTPDELPPPECGE